MQIIPMRELKNTVEIEYYERTMKEMEEAKLIMEGLRDVDEGRVVDGPMALEEIRREYGL